MKRKRTQKRRPPRFTSLRKFLEMALSDREDDRRRWKPADVIQVLDNIEQGFGLQERDRALAENFNEIPSDDENPAFRRGWLEGHLAGVKAGRAELTEDETTAVAVERGDVDERATAEAHSENERPPGNRWFENK